MKAIILSFLSAYSASVSAYCIPAGNVFPLPSKLPQAALDRISAAAKKAIESVDIGNQTTISIELTSPGASFFEWHHKGPLQPNATEEVNGDSVYRIASVTKTFAALSLLLADEDPSTGVHLDDSVVKYYPELGEGIREDGVQWKDVTLRSLASHLGGLDREAGMLDILFFAPQFDFATLGLPPLPEDKNKLMCDTGFGSNHCTEDEVIKFLKQTDHGFSQPMDRATYSNGGFVLLGMTLARALKQSFPDICQSRIFNKLNMTRSSFVPPKENGVNPIVTPAFPGLRQGSDWDLEFYELVSAGAMYSSTHDLCSFVRGVMTAKIMSQRRINQWLKPAVFGSSLDHAYGMPWEIIRKSNTTKSRRVVDVYSKNGAIGAYISNLFMFPDFGFGGAILSGGEQEANGKIFDEILDAMAYELEEAGREHAREKYAGTYISSDPKLNSTLVLHVDDTLPGIQVDSWISNGTDIFTGVAAYFNQMKPATASLFPVSRNDNPESPSGTVQFRAILRAIGEDSVSSSGCGGDISSAYYIGRPLQEFRFKVNDSGVVTAVEMPALRVTLTKTSTGSGKYDNNRTSKSEL